MIILWFLRPWPSRTSIWVIILQVDANIPLLYEVVWDTNIGIYPGLQIQPSYAPWHHF